MSEVITTEAKKAYMLLNSIIFHYHGLDEEEEHILQRIAQEASAGDELKWAFEYISKDYLTAYERARLFLKDAMLKLDKSKRLDFINNTWQANFEKGYITEMEATAMLKLAQDWDVDDDLIQIVQQV